MFKDQTTETEFYSVAFQTQIKFDFGMVYLFAEMEVDNNNVGNSKMID